MIPKALFDHSLESVRAPLMRLGPDPVLVIGQLEGGLIHVAAADGVTLLHAELLLMQATMAVDRLRTEGPPSGTGDPIGTDSGRKLFDWICRQRDPRDTFRRAKKLALTFGWSGPFLDFDGEQAQAILHELEKPRRGSSRWGGPSAGGSAGDGKASG